MSGYRASVIMPMLATWFLIVAMGLLDTAMTGAANRLRKSTGYSWI